jgi:hypothetical protein
MKENKPIQFGLKSIRTDQFATAEATNVQDNKVQLDHSFTFSLNNTGNELTVTFKLSFKSEEQLFIILQVSCVFGIEPDDLLISSSEEPKKIQIPKGFMAHLAFITTGTARGILHAKLEQTEFNKYLLPILDVSTVFENDADFDLPQNQ